MACWRGMKNWQPSTRGINSGEKTAMYNLLAYRHGLAAYMAARNMAATLSLAYHGAHRKRCYRSMA